VQLARFVSSCRLSIEELSNLGALSDIRGSLRGMYDSVVASLIQEVIALTFQRPPSAQALVAGGNDTKGCSPADREEAVRGAVVHHPRITALLAEQQDAAILNASGFGGGLDLGGEQSGDAQMRRLVGFLIQLDALAPLRQRLVPATGRQVCCCECCALSLLKREGTCSFTRSQV
jgi:hypothetical protein